MAATMEPQDQPQQHGRRSVVVAGAAHDVALGRVGGRLSVRCCLIPFDNYLLLIGEITGHKPEA